MVPTTTTPTTRMATPTPITPTETARTVPTTTTPITPTETAREKTMTRLRRLPELIHTARCTMTRPCTAPCRRSLVVETWTATCPAPPTGTPTATPTPPFTVTRGCRAPHLACSPAWAPPSMTPTATFTARGTCTRMRTA